MVEKNTFITIHMIFSLLVVTPLHGMLIDLVKYPVSIIDNALKNYASDFYCITLRDGRISDEELYTAAQQGQTSFLKSALLFKNPNFLYNGFSPLYTAVKNEKIAAVKLLLDHHADGQKPNDYWVDTKTPIEKAFELKNSYILGLLLAKQPNLAATKKESALSILQKKYTDDEKSYIADFLVKHQNLDATIATACATDQVEDLEELIKIHKPSAHKVFLQLLDSNRHGALLGLILKYAGQLNTIDQHLSQQQIQKLVVNDISTRTPSLLRDLSYEQLIQIQTVLSKHDGNAAFYLLSSLTPGSLPTLEMAYHQSLEPTLTLIHSLLPKKIKLEEEYKTISSKELLRWPSLELSSVEDERFKNLMDLYTVPPIDDFFKRVRAAPLITNNRYDIKWYSLAWLTRYSQELAKRVHEYHNYLENTTECPICLEKYGNKPHVMICANHSVCLGCFNHPTVDKCPLCRAECNIEKLSMCQSCRRTSTELRPSYCKDCKSINILCRHCSFACCKKAVDDTSYKSAETAICKSAEVTTWAKENIKQTKLNYQKAIAQLNKEYSAILKPLNDQINALELEIKLLSAQHTKLRAEYQQIPSFARSAYYYKHQELTAIEWSIKNKTDQRDNYIEEANTYLSAYEEKEVECQKRCRNALVSIVHLVGERMFDYLQIQIEQEQTLAAQQAQQTFNQLNAFFQQLFNGSTNRDDY